jgi:hypothetical protein
MLAQLPTERLARLRGGDSDAFLYCVYIIEREGGSVREGIVLIGAGSASFTQGLVADLLQRDMEADVALVDVDPTALEVAEQLARKMVDARRPDAHVGRCNALAGATAVSCTVGVATAYTRTRGHRSQPMREKESLSDTP